MHISVIRTRRARVVCIRGILVVCRLRYGFQRTHLFLFSYFFVHGADVTAVCALYQLRFVLLRVHAFAQANRSYGMDFPDIKSCVLWWHKTNKHTRECTEPFSCRSFLLRTVSQASAIYCYGFTLMVSDLLMIESIELSCTKCDPYLNGIALTWPSSWLRQFSHIFASKLLHALGHLTVWQFIAYRIRFDRFHIGIYQYRCHRWRHFSFGIWGAPEHRWKWAARMGRTSLKGLPNIHFLVATIGKQTEWESCPFRRATSHHRSDAFTHESFSLQLIRISIRPSRTSAPE